MNKYYLFLSALICGCTATRENKPAEVPAGFIAVTVKDFSGLDGCNFLFVLDDSTRYEVVNLPDSLKTDGLKLYVRTLPVKDHMSICMGGKAVRLNEVRTR